MSTCDPRHPCWYCGQIVSIAERALAGHMRSHSARGEVLRVQRFHAPDEYYALNPLPDWRTPYPQGWWRDADGRIRAGEVLT